MKKSSVFKFAIVLSLISASNACATLIDAVPDGVGSQGNSGTVGDPLIVGEEINIKLVLKQNSSWCKL